MRRKKTAAVEEKKKKKTPSQTLSQFLDMPESAFFGTAQMEVFGNSEAVIEGCKGIIEYDQGIIRLNTGNMIVRFQGTDLELKCFNEMQTVVRGNIATIDFM